jgi:hypothetical protein
MTTAVPIATAFYLRSDRRSTRRYPVQQNLRYRLLHPRPASVAGVGETLNISSSGILFTAEGSLPEGQAVEVSVNWPARINGSCALKLVAVGRVIRSDQRRSAIRIEKYQFKTRRS